MAPEYKISIGSIVYIICITYVNAVPIAGKMSCALRKHSKTTWHPCTLSTDDEELTHTREVEWGRETNNKNRNKTFKKNISKGNGGTR